MKKSWEVMSRRQWLVPPRVSPFNVNGLIDTLRMTFLERQQLHYGKKRFQKTRAMRNHSQVCQTKETCVSWDVRESERNISFIMYIYPFYLQTDGSSEGVRESVGSGDALHLK